MVDKPFNLDHLSDLPLYVERDSFQSVCDDKSGYDHIMMSPDSWTFFGFEWGGWFFTSNSIPFGWKLSAFIYHNTGLLASHYFRSIGIPCSLYIDDRHTSQLRVPSDSAIRSLSLDQEQLKLTFAHMASLLVCCTLIRLGYFINLDKSTLIPSQCVLYLGFLCDSQLQAFCLNEMNMAISRASRSSRPLSLSGPLRKEIEHWLFLNDWSGVLSSAFPTTLSA